MAATNERRALDRWARNQGYADFDTYIRIGGSIAEARADIGHRIAMLESARVALGGYGDNEREDVPQPHDPTNPFAPTERHDSYHSAPAIGPDALAAAEADAVGEPIDADNAQIQGFNHAGD
jgi:hypothetical protein